MAGKKTTPSGGSHYNHCSFCGRREDEVALLLTGQDGAVSAGLAATMSAFPNSTVAQPDYSEAPEQFQSFYELYKDNYVINEYIGLPNASDVMTNMTNDLVKYLEGDIEVDAMLENWQGYLDEAGN